MQFYQIKPAGQSYLNYFFFAKRWTRFPRTEHFVCFFCVYFISSYFEKNIKKPTFPKYLICFLFIGRLRSMLHCLISLVYVFVCKNYSDAVHCRGSNSACRNLVQLFASKPNKELLLLLLLQTQTCSCILCIAQHNTERILLYPVHCSSDPEQCLQFCVHFSYNHFKPFKLNRKQEHNQLLLNGDFNGKKNMVSLWKP